MTGPHRGSRPHVSASIDPVDLFRRAEELFTGMFHIEELVAASSVRALFVARHAVLDRRVAVHVHLDPDVAGRRWFERETVLLANLDHPGIRPIHSAGYRGSWAYRVSKWIEGESLLDAVERGPRPIPDVLQLARDLISALDYAHAEGLVLRRLVPSSINKIFDELLYGEAPTPVRVANFVRNVNALDTRLALELASGLLHNTAPNDYWLWTRWLWDPSTGTGILPLLVGSTHNLLADNLADGYARVGVVSALSLKFGEGTGLCTNELMASEQRAQFANSAFLACAYNVYLYGTTSWRLSREFNNLLPSLPNMARKLLGLKKIKEEETPMVK